MIPSMVAKCVGCGMLVEVVGDVDDLDPTRYCCLDCRHKRQDRIDAGRTLETRTRPA